MTEASTGLDWVTLELGATSAPSDALTDYSRGFLVTAGETQKVPAAWREQKIGRWTLAHDPRLNVSGATDGRRSVLFCGEVLDAEETAKEIPIAVGEQWTGRSSPQSVLDQLGGRFVVMLFQEDGSLRVQTSGAALRSVVYATDGTAASTHENLLASNLLLGRADDWDVRRLRREGIKYTPGVRSSHKALRKLSGNSEVLLHPTRQAQVSRIPISVGEERRAEEVSEELLPRLSAQLHAYFAGKEKVLVPLTAGLDSRTTLSLLGPHLDKCEFFTFALRHAARQEFVNSDVAMALELADYLGIDHRIVEVNGDQRPDEVKTLMRHSNPREGVAVVAWHLRKSFPEIEHHLTSFMYEVGQGHYLKRRRPPISPTEMARLIAREGREPTTPTIEAFDEFVVRTSFPTEGLNPYDRYYWEHRMTIWGGGMMAEYDFGQSAMSLLSAREDLLRVLAPPVNERVSSRYQTALISEAWPELLSFPVNKR